MSSQLLFQGLLLGVIAWIAISDGFQRSSCDGSSYLQKARQQGVLNFMVNAGADPPVGENCSAFPDDSFPFTGINCRTTKECTWDEFLADFSCWFFTVENKSNFCVFGNETENFTNQVTAMVMDLPDESRFICMDVPPGLCPTVVCVKSGNGDLVLYDFLLLFIFWPY